ncbi:MAG TPA: CHAT domain-containing protein [Lacipirellulaceae bacterium]
MLLVPMPEEAMAMNSRTLLSFGGRRSAPPRSTLALALLLGLFVAAPARAELGEDIPKPAYYSAINELYNGDYHHAERDFRNLVRGAIKTVNARWIDSICYHAMLGEALFHEGRNPEALEEFDAAAQMLLAYPDWMLRVVFDDPRVDANAQRRQPPWGQSQRRFVLGGFPRGMRIAIGQLDNSKAYQQGGAVLQPQYWRINAAEIVRASALAIRRRNELLGPLGKYDQTSRQLANTLSRGNLVQANHWSTAWAELLNGVAQEGVGNVDQGRAHLEHAVIVAGEFDHPLTGVALLEQGRLAMAAGDSRTAAQLLVEASYSGFYFEDFDVVSEALWLGFVNHAASGATDPYPPLEAAVAWAQTNRVWHLAARLRLGQAQILARGGQLQQAASIADDMGKRIGDMKNGLPGIELLFLQALVHLGQGQYGPGGETLDKALAEQATASVRNFQIARASGLYDAGDISPRVATDLFKSMLAEPTAADWSQRSLDTLAVMRTPHDDAYDRWFLAALERKDLPQAVEISERAKRQRFLSTLPLGGRLLALRAILEAPESELPTEAALERQQLLANFPAYRDLSAAATQLYQQLRDGPVIMQGGAAGQTLNDQLAAWSQNASARENLVLAMALSPVPSTMVFPPLRTTAELQKSLAAGEALVVFHEAGGNLYGFLLSKTDAHVWQLESDRQVERTVTDLLRALGNFGPNREMGAVDLKDNKWPEAAGKTYEAVFGEARLDLAKTTSLVIVPDSWLWYLPFEALVPPGAKTAGVLADRFPIHYGPTASLAIGDARPFRRAKHTGIVASDVSADALKPLMDAVEGGLQLSPPLPQPGYLLVPLLDELIVMDNVELDRTNAYGWSPLPKARAKGGDSLSAWMELPYEGADRVVLAGFPSAAESGLKASRREKGPGGAPGSELFQTTCALMASGSRTVLLTRWRTGGQTNLELVREFVQELPNGSAADAWQRSIAVGRELPLDPSQEPRLKKLEDTAEAPKASHPFFWAGYLLVDTGTRPGQEAESGANSPAGAAAQKTPPGDKPAEAGKAPPAGRPPVPSQSTPPSK